MYKIKDDIVNFKIHNNYNNFEWNTAVFVLKYIFIKLNHYLSYQAESELVATATATAVAKGVAKDFLYFNAR